MMNSEIIDLLRETALKMTGYGEQEATAWARGVVDGHAMAHPTVPLEKMNAQALEAFAQQAAAR